MKRAAQLFSGAALVLGLVAFGAGAAGAQVSRHRWFGQDGGRQAVFVQTDNLSGNQVVAYERAGNGTLSLAGTYDTGGLGGQLAGSVVDHLASQGSLGYSSDHDLLFAVNAGSNTVSVFGVRGDHLALKEILPSGGTFPVSVAVHGDLVYVLNAENGGSLQGYRIQFGYVLPTFGSNRALGLDPTETPQFTHTPGQVAFSPDGSQLIVTTKANGNDIDVFRVFADGRLSSAPQVNPEPGAIPFADHLRPGRQPRRRRDRDRLAGDVLSQRLGRRHRTGRRVQHPGRYLLGGLRGREPLCLQCRQRVGEPVPGHGRRDPLPPGPDVHRPGNG